MRWGDFPKVNAFGAFCGVRTAKSPIAGMTEQRTSEPAPLSDLDVEDATKRSARRGPLSVVNRLLGRMSIFVTTALLTGVAVVIAVSLNWVLGQIGLLEFTWRIFTAATVVTILTGAPIIVYSQFIIREMKSSRRMLRKMTERLAWAFHNAERANEAKSHFLANMSHELRTPLNAIIGFSDIMRNERFGPLNNDRYRDYARDVNESGIHLLGIINEILDLAKIEAGHATMESETEFEVGAVIGSAERMVRPMAEARGVRLVVDANNCELRIRAVERMVRQVLINVLSNAVKFTEADGLVTLSAEYRPHGNFVISIADTGIGMSPDEVKLALTPFGQADNTLTRQHVGTGLGLPLAKAMMDLHGGRLMVRSEKGAGTAVVLIFPNACVIDAPSPVRTARAS